mmetsp:Transcript_34004/g.70730  ORF Transcript_34004/g.70730 Transcript_34004/m.70730 type:complete len:85 (+) Transcript_34004:936-1190(+)
MLHARKKRFSRIVQDGYFTMSQLRSALHQVKLHLTTSTFICMFMNHLYTFTKFETSKKQKKHQKNKTTKNNNKKDKHIYIFTYI